MKELEEIVEEARFDFGNNLGLVCFAFGDRCSAQTNRRIVARARWLRERYGYPCLAQVFVPVPGADPVNETVDKYKSTLGVAEEAVEWAQRMSLTEIRAVAASPHVGRCVRDICEIAGRRGLDLSVGAESVTPVWDPLARQWQVRGPRLFGVREWILRRLPWWLYVRVTK